MMRSRLRRPTSKSITAVLCPRSARPDAKLALVVVLPTPPLPEVTTTILVIGRSSFQRSSRLQRLDDEPVAFQPNLGRLAGHVVRQGGVDRSIRACDRHQLG